MLLHIVRNLVGKILKLVINRDLAVVTEPFDFCLSILFPVLDVRVVANAERTALQRSQNVVRDS